MSDFVQYYHVIKAVINYYISYMCFDYLLALKDLFGEHLEDIDYIRTSNPKLKELQLKYWDC